MPPQPPIPPPPPGVVRPIHGIESLHDAVKGGVLNHVQLGRGVMAGETGYAGLGAGVLGYGRADLGVRTGGCFNPVGSALGVMIELPRPARMWGAECGAGAVLLCPPGTEADAFVPGPQFYAYLILPAGDWGRAVAALAPAEADGLVRRRRVVCPPPALAGALVRRFTTLIDLITGGRLPPREAAAAAGEELLDLAVRAVTAGADAAEPCGRYFRHQRIVTRAEEYLRDRMREDVYAREVCEHCGVSERTLQYAFRDVLGSTLTAHLRRRRLTAVRCELVAPGPDLPSVTRAALRWGFWHLGEFAAAYRDFFGESPAETARRSRAGVRTG